MKKWISLAERAAAEALAALPEEVRQRAERLPVTCMARPTAAMHRDGVDPDLLGLFVGEALGESGSSGLDLPAQIILFTENLAEYSDFDETIFFEEARRTYLHELGHYLGWDESDLSARDLD